MRLVVLKVHGVMYTPHKILALILIVFSAIAYSNNVEGINNVMKFPVKYWKAVKPRAIIIAVHGFNDYSNFFRMPGNFLKEHGITSYAYDQRGFGGTENIGVWAGTYAYANDLNTFIKYVNDLHPELPIYILGASMGAAVVSVARTMKSDIDCVKGIIFVAPAVLTSGDIPWYQEMIISASKYLPWLRINDTPILNVEFSDNMEILKGLKEDPLVIKDIEISSIHGVIDLMKTAVTNAPLIREDTLVLWGNRDDVIPQVSVENFLSRLPRNQLTSIFYKKGYHMLLRDLQAQRVWDDILNWIDNRDFKFSGELIIRDDASVTYQR